MKRILLLFLLISVAVSAVALQPQRNGATAFLTTHLPIRSELASIQQHIVESAFVQHVVSGDWSPTLLELVPEDALLMFDMKNAGAAGKALLASRFGETVTAIHWPAVLKQLDVPPMFRLLLERQIADAQSLLAHPLLQDIFSRRTVVAMLPENPQQLRNDPLHFVLEQTLLLTTPQEKSSAALLSVTKMLGIPPELLSHQGISILVFNLSQSQKLYVSALGNSIAFSLGLQPIQQSIDVFVRHFIVRQSGLLHNREYVEMKAEAQGKDDIFLYADLSQLRSFFKGESTAFRRLSFYHQANGEAVQFKAAVRFTPDNLPPIQKEFLAASPMLNHTLGKMPASLPFYFWSDWLKPNFLQQILIAEGKQDRVEQMEVWFKAQTGLSLNEILSLFGQEFSVNIAEISTAGFFPVPRLCFIVEVREQAKVERLLARLISGLPVKREKVAETPVVSLLVAKGMLQPSYAFADGFLLLADSREQLEDILEGQSERMPKSRLFQTAAASMGQPSNLMLFVRAAALVDGLKELVAWAGTMTAINDELAGEKSKVLIDQVIIPLLDSLSACGAVSLRSVVKPGELVIEAAALHTEEKAIQAVQAEN